MSERFVYCVFAISCSKDASNSSFVPIPGEIVYKSPCKSSLKSSANTNIKTNQSCVEYSYDELSKTLTLKHLNAGFHCSPDSIWCTTSTDKNILLIEERQQGLGERGYCLYDIMILVGNIEKQKYFVKFVEPYCEDQVKLEFDIDLNLSPTGSFCVNRHQTAWY